MVNELKVFNNEEFGKVRIGFLNDELILNLSDVCFALGYTKTAKGNDYLRKDLIENICQSLDITGLSPTDNYINIVKTINFEDTFINENNFYDLCLESKAKNARKFRKWVTNDVIPSIRKHGAYMTGDTIEKLLADPDTIIKLATTLKEEKEARKLAEQKVKEAEPKISFADKIEFTKANIDMKKFADLINIKGFGRNKLLEWLRSNGYLNKRNEPYRNYVDQGIFETKERVVDLGSIEKIQITTFVTGKGQTYLHNKILNSMKIGA